MAPLVNSSSDSDPTASDSVVVNGLLEGLGRVSISNTVGLTVDGGRGVGLLLSIVLTLGLSEEIGLTAGSFVVCLDEVGREDDAPVDGPDVPPSS